MSVLIIKTLALIDLLHSLSGGETTVHLKV